MREKEIIDLLRLYRHDLMNDLQIVQGYLLMGKMDKVEDKLAACIARFNEERKLMSLNVPKFALWLIQFNSIHGTFRLTYDINTENKNFLDLDSKLIRHCQLCIELVESVATSTEVYEGNVLLDFQENSSEITVTISFDGVFKKLDAFEIDLIEKDQQVDIHIEQEEDGITCNITIPCN